MAGDGARTRGVGSPRVESCVVGHERRVLRIAHKVHTPLNFSKLKHAICLSFANNNFVSPPGPGSTLSPRNSRGNPFSIWSAPPSRIMSISGMSIISRRRLFSWCLGAKIIEILVWFGLVWFA